MKTDMESRTNPSQDQVNTKVITKESDHYLLDVLTSVVKRYLCIVDERCPNSQNGVDFPNSTFSPQTE